MCNTAPLFHKNQATIIHDVAPARVPHSYGRLFRAWYRFMTPIIYSGSASICTVSHFSREELSSLFGVRPDICVLPEGTDHMHRIKADPSVLDRHNLRQRPYVFAVSSLAAHKNFSAVGRAIHLLGDPGFDVAVAGAENPKVFGHAGEDLPPFIRKLGYVSDAELKALYENAGCFIFPSIYEGFGLPPVEAMSCGCPVIASNAASIPEVCGQAAQYFDPFDAGMLADTLRRVMADSRLRAQMRLDGLRRAADLRWEASALALLQEIRRIDF
jgi:glycosyltransferase involved in cell wall biosynthesis